MPDVNFKMIELARQVRGVTQKELADSLNLTQPTLSKIEKGVFGITDETIKKISEKLDFPVAFFYQKEASTPISNIYFRKRAAIGQRQLDKILGDVKLLLICIDSFLEEVDITEYPKFKFDLSDGWTPPSVAIRMREILKVPNGPINEPIRLLENLGIIVFLYDCPDLRFDGLTAYTDSGVPVIFVNKNLPSDRIRFTIGHEFFHLLSHLPCDIEPWRDYEQEANEFPGEFFMPTRDCSRDLTGLSFNQLTGLKSYWGLSKAAIIYKAKATGFINEATYKYMMIELGRRNERKNESGYAEIDSPQTLQQIVDLLKTELGYSDQDIADKLCIPLDDYVRLFEPKDRPTVKIKRLRPAI